MKVLELNDHGISIGDESGILACSPGYAVAIGKELEFGRSAASKSKLYPGTSSNEFWHRLSMDPLVRPIAHYRHHADIAYSHLLHLAEQSAWKGEVLVAVPGSFSRQQLAILLGLFKHSPFQVAGLIDSAVAAAVDKQQSQTMVYADIQLHQVVLSQLHVQGDDLVRDAVIQIPGVGWSNLADSLVQLITDAFIQQSRFNPQHNAQWEQHLYDSLPGWLGQNSNAENNLLLEIQTDNALHQVKLTRASVIARLQPFYRKIAQHLLDMPGKQPASVVVLLAERFGTLPGLNLALDTAGLSVQERVSTESLMQSCLRYRDQLRGSGKDVGLTSRLQATTNSSSNTVKSAPRRVLGQLEQQEEQFVLRNGAPGWLVNGLPAEPEHNLTTGDILRFGELGQALQVIQVEDGSQ